MEKFSEHHVLPLNVQEEHDKQSIRNIIEMYNIDDAVLMLYTAIIELRSQRDDYIDECINRINDEIRESRKLNTDD